MKEYLGWVKNAEQSHHSTFLSITTLPEPVLLWREVTALDRTPVILSLLAAIVAETSDTTSLPERGDEQSKKDKFSNLQP